MSLKHSSMLQIPQDILNIMPLLRNLTIEDPNGNVLLSSEDTRNMMEAHRAAAAGSSQHQPHPAFPKPERGDTANSASGNQARPSLNTTPSTYAYQPTAYPSHSAGGHSANRSEHGSPAPSMNRFGEQQQPRQGFVPVRASAVRQAPQQYRPQEQFAASTAPVSFLAVSNASDKTCQPRQATLLQPVTFTQRKA